MCLAIPMKVLALDGDGMAKVSAMGAEREIAIDLTPQAQVGDHVLVHAGFAIEVVDEDYANETLELIQQMTDLIDDPLIDAQVQ